MELRLIVLRSKDPLLLAEFYGFLGLQFDYHRHGTGPYHYSTTSLGKTVLEIYPLTKSQLEADKNIRLGFSIDNFDNSIKIFKEKQFIFLAEPAQTEYGYMAVVSDPDGRKIELYRNY